MRKSQLECLNHMSYEYDTSFDCMHIHSCKSNHELVCVRKEKRSPKSYEPPHIGGGQLGMDARVQYSL